MWSRNCIRSFFTFTCCTQINCIAITTFLAVLEDKAIGAQTFFFYQVIDHCIYTIPAQLLFSLVRRAVAYNNNLTFRTVAQT